MIQQFHFWVFITKREKKENTNSKRYRYLHVHCNTIYNSQYMEQTMCPLMDMDKKKSFILIYTCTHTHTHTLEYYSAIKKNEILPSVTTSMNLQGIMLNEMSDRERQIP